MNVITPLNRLLAMFQGPVKVIKKRYDKLLDYDNLSSRVKNLRDSEQQLHSVSVFSNIFSPLFIVLNNCFLTYRNM